METRNADVERCNQRCAAARRMRDPTACLVAAREAVRLDSAHPMGWRNLCWSLWTLRRYADASAACRSAAAHRDWRPRVRARIMTLDRACSMMMALERARATEEECPSARLLRGWYATTLRNLVSEARLEVFAAPPAAGDVSPDVIPAPARGLWLRGPRIDGSRPRQDPRRRRGGSDHQRSVRGQSGD